jgi:hypothetical protein
MGSSGHSVKIWLRFTRPDKSLPKSREEAEIFQAHAYRKAVGLCQPALSYAIELKKPTLDQFCRQTYDPELYYNPDSTFTKGFCATTSTPFSSLLASAESIVPKSTTLVDDFNVNSFTTGALPIEEILIT